MESIPRRNTDPLWLQDHDLTTRHTEETTNATATFISRKGKIYLVTCAHVVKSLAELRMLSAPTLALHSGDHVININSTSVRRLDIKTEMPSELGEEAYVDIAIAPMPSEDWNLLSREKFKVAIDLDLLVEPDWQSSKFGLAVGYPNEHKAPTYAANEMMVGAPKLDVIAHFKGNYDGLLVIQSKLDKAHGYFFSGMSGGALYAIEGDFGDHVEDEALKFAGIICKGGPQSREGEELVPPDQILIAAIPVNSSIFDEWLTRAGLE